MFLCFVMRKRLLVLLLVSGVLNYEVLCREVNDLTQPECTAMDDLTSDFLKCVGFPSERVTEEQQFLHLKGTIDAVLDVFVFMREGLGGVPLLNVSAGWNFNATALLHDNDVVTAWLQIRLTPLLSSISHNFLTCLGYNNFSCQTYQTVVQELSQQFSSLDAERQQWIYSYFMRPFLSQNTPAGCVIPGDTTEEWVTKNFGSFSVLAQIRDFSSINGFFNGLDVLHMMTPEQKAQLVLYPERAGLNTESHSVVLSSLLRSLTASGGAANNLNMQSRGLPTYSPALGQTLNDIMTAFRPVGSFVRDFVSFTHQHDLSTMRSATLVQAMLNWTLAELAAPYKNTSEDQQLDQVMFYGTDVNSWFTHVVVPVLNRYLTGDIPDELTAVFHNVFYMENPVNETQDVCSVSLDGSCAVANVMEHVAKVLQCAGSTNLTLTQETLTSLVLHLSRNLNTLLNRIANTNFSAEDSPFSDVLDRIHNPTHTDLSDNAFITMWFHIKLKPLLASVTPDYLLCLSAKPFSCQTFQTLVLEMSNNMFLLPENGTQVVYEQFIKSFLLHQNTTGVCMSNSSLEWMVRNLGAFSHFATVQEIYLLNPEFDALDAFSALSVKQISEIIVEDLPQLPDKAQLIDMVFSDMLTSVTMREQIPQLITLVSQRDTMKNCLIYTEMFSWLHFTSLFTNPETEAVILWSINVLMKVTPPACRSYSGMCNTIPTNASRVCNGVNSDALLNYMKTPHNGSRLCSFNITQYACAQMSDISAEDLETLLSCYLYGNEVISEETWKIFLTKFSSALGPALDLFTNQTGTLSRPLVVNMLDAIGDVTFSTFSSSNYTTQSLIQLWFVDRLRPFLPYASPNFLSCISKYNFNCDNYQSIVQILSQQVDSMSNETQMSVYVFFIHPFLSNNQTSGCNVGGPSSDWLNQNFGYFSKFATISELQNLNPTFSVMDALDSLSITQLVEVCTSPGLITSSSQVVQVVDNIPDSDLSMFFSELSSTLTVGSTTLPTEVSEAFLEQVFARVNLEDPNVPDSEVEQWINIRMKPFISNIQISQIPLYFNILTQHSCSVQQQGVMVLNSAYSSFSSDTLQSIYNQLIISLSGPELMMCYNNQSFYAFLKPYFIGFQFPSLSTFLSLIPPGRMSQFLNSISPAELSDLLNNTSTVDQNQLCDLFNIYNQTTNYLQSEPVLSPDLAVQTLVCVWPRALSSSSQADSDRWFNTTLVQYLPFLSAHMISSTQMDDVSCTTFSMFVSVMGRYNFSTANFTEKDVYSTIQSYLTTENTPKCYDPTNPTLSSTAWFLQYIGGFISFITVDDLEQFGGLNLAPFTSNTQDLELLSQYNVSQDVLSLYANMLFYVEPDSSIKILPLQLWCFAPANAFSNLSQSDALSTIKSLQDQCTDIDPTVSAALASNVDILTSNAILALGSSITSLSVGQIADSSPSALLSTLAFLSSTIGWSESQATAIIQSLLSSGLFRITSVESLQLLGSLLIGMQSTIFDDISAESLFTALQSQTFLNNIISSPVTTQQVVVNQIISLNSNPDSIVQNVPEKMTQLIPCPLLLSLSQQTATTLNQKQWNSNQAMLFFNVVAEQFNNTDNISFQVLQGFTCTRVQLFSTVKVTNLIKSCRRRANQKITLQESQLTCMYNYIKSNSVTVFTDYPADMLLYYNVSQLQPSMCQSYYSALGEADFSIFSPTLAYRREVLFMNACQCLGVSGWNVSHTQLDVMGTMVCVFNSSYILNSDPYVLEKLKLCPTLTADQSSAVELVLLKGNTVYGGPASWNQTTLTSLGVLPLYLTSNFWSYFTQIEKVNFLRVFVPVMKAAGVSRLRIYTLISQAGQTSKTRSLTLFRLRRDTACTVGQITQIQASDASFPLGYDVNQFDACLSVQTLKDNLLAIADKATGSDFQVVIINKLNQAYPTSISDQVLQDLGPASRAASVSDINKWNITSVDTLAALMKPNDGAWSPEQVRAIVSRYLRGNQTLGFVELNALGGTNLCALDINLLKTITPDSLKFMDPPSLSNCSSEQKQLLFNIIQINFINQTLNTRSTSTTSADTYQLIRTYLGGASLAYVLSLSSSNISMELLTFITLDQNVINNLTVSQVQGLLGRNTPDLKTYENNLVVHSWIIQQLQSSLDTLGIGLTGGRSLTTAIPTAANANTTASANTTSSANANATTIKPSGAGSSISASSGIQKLLLLFLLGVTMATLQLIH